MLKHLIKDKKLNLNVRATAAEMDAIKANAKKFTNGKISEWVRYSAMNYVPPRSKLKD